MMNFNFRLERVLNFKETVEELKKAEYGSAQRRLNQEEDKLNSYNQYKSTIKDEKNLSASKTNVGNLAMYSDYIRDLDKKIKNQEEVVTNTKIKLEEVKEEMIEAVQDKKAFVKLKEKEYEKYLYQVKKQEEKQVDTIVNYKTSTQK